MDKRRFLVLFGSQTGNAQEVAERIWRDGKLHHFTGPVLAMDDYKVSELIDEPVVIFVCSTTGQGEEPDNMKSFWKFLLRKNLPLNSLQNVRCAVLGLGDSSYVKFNFVAKKLTRRLLQLGGKSLVRTGFADDQHDLGASAVVDPWIKDLWKVLVELYPLTENIAHVDSTLSLCPSRWSVTLQSDAVANRQSWSGGYVAVAVVENTRTTAPTHFQDVRLIKLHASEVTYQSGDVLMVRPCNLPSNIDQLFSILSANTTAQLRPNTVVQIEPTYADMPVPHFLSQPISLRQCAEEYWDLMGIPQQFVFQLLAHFTTSQLEREKCLEFCSPEGQEELFSYCYRPRRTVLEVLADFSSATPNIPIEYWFELLRPIRPRAFSIASSPAAHRGEIHVLVAVVKYYTALVAPRLGLCSNWLAALSVGSSVTVQVRKGSLTFPRTQDIPIIMIGPGTGVAPFRSYVQDCAARSVASDNNLYLFFGCRNKSGDFHFQNEWLDFKKKKQLTFFCAFSRDQEHKVYVQHVMEEVAAVLWDLIANKNGYVFLAGSSKNMPSAVRETLTDCVFQQQGRISKEEAVEYLHLLEKSGRFQSETWS